MKIPSLFQKIINLVGMSSDTHAGLPLLTLNKFKKLLEQNSEAKRNLKGDKTVSMDVNCYVNSGLLAYYNWMETAGKDFSVLAQPLHFSEKDNRAHYMPSPSGINSYKLTVATLTGNGRYKQHHENSILLNTTDREVLKKIIADTARFYQGAKSVEKTLEWVKVKSPYQSFVR